MNERWRNLTDEQLQGADYALRVAMTWPGFRGKTLAVLMEQRQEVYAEMRRRAVRAVGLALSQSLARG